MQIARLALVAAVLTSAAAGAATNRTDPGFVYNGQNGPFVTEGATACPGTLIPSLPGGGSGDTCTGGASNTITNYGGVCGAALPFPYPGPEDIYQLNLGAGNNVGFSMSLAGSTGDLVLYLVGTCGDGSSCVANSQDAIGPGMGPEDIPAASYPAGDYFVYVDSYYASGGDHCGTYTLSVTGTLPVELLEFQVN